MHKKKKTQSKSKIVVTEKDRKKYGVCEHDQVNYKALNKMCDGLLLHCKRLSRDIDRKGKWIEVWMKTHKILQENLARKEPLYLKKLNDLKTKCNETINAWAIQNDQLKADLKEAYKVNKDVVLKNKDCIQKNTEILKDHHEITRAYNGLHSMGKFAEEEGIDIKKHNRQLPENMEFHQSHELMESGRVKHVYGIKKKKNKKNGEAK